MSEIPYFSVVTVCRNETESIRLTCDSLCGQSFNNVEWIIIDGGSTDGTLDVLAEYKDRINVLVSEPDQGVYDAMNKGIARATGQYLVFMNGGDQFADNHVLQCVADAPKADIIYGDILLAQDEGTMVVKRLPDTLPRNFLMRGMIPHQAAYYRRDLFKKYGNYDTSYSIAADYDLFVRLIHVEGVSFSICQSLCPFSRWMA